MLLASQAVFYNVIFGLLEGWLTFNWKGGSVSIGKVAHFHFGKLAHFREEIPAGPAARIVPVHLAHLAAVIRIFRLN